MDIAFVDVIGIPYKHDSLKTSTVGGSEAATINLSRYLSQGGHSVTVFHNCEEEGVFNEVTFQDTSKIRENKKEFDILICSRSLHAVDIHTEYFIKAKTNILWMHDYFVHGNYSYDQLTSFLDKNILQYIFTLSDWHTNYVLTHLGVRVYDPDDSYYHYNGFSIYKNKIIQTCNGFTPWDIGEIKLEEKDKNKFVYFSNVGRGLHQLLQKWSEIKLAIPNATLHVVGGSYKTDTSKNEVLSKYKKTYKEDSSIIFVPKMPQQELYLYLKDAYLIAYPNQYQETFCISVLESMYCGTPMVTSRWGALEETADESANLLIDGMAFDEDYFEKFIAGLSLLYYNNSIWESKAENCVRLLRDNDFTWKSIAAEWETIFKRITKV